MLTERDPLVVIDVRGRPSVRCRAADVLAAHVDVKGSEYVIVLTVTRGSGTLQLTLPCANEAEAGSVMAYLADKMREGA